MELLQFHAGNRNFGPRSDNGFVDHCTLPHAVTDNNVENAAADQCDFPGPTRSFYYGTEGQAEYCPPVLLFEDTLGPTNLLMDAEFSFSEMCTVSGAIRGQALVSERTSIPVS